ncbi:RHS repeat-associated core domain-containing protein [Chryseobacterium sp. GP-SGM7]|uniref:RHS repeat-associated core domain-containing protein n=1 Tax=Chryseobacterium sp. GP-SGM7 TaxID=3411323 RepID=UPI003B954CAD
MTQVNNPNDLTGGDLFGYKIKYNQVEGLENPNTDFLNLQVKPKYNGNIAEIDWRTNTTTGDNLRRYGYVYDGLNRLKAGFYQRDDNPTAKEYFEKIDYDLNGNITNLKRSASKDGNAFATAIDNLDYVYENNNQSNRLSTVTDTSQNYKGYPDTSGNAITYDLNGNMKSHKDKNILEIRYNYLNLPNYIKSDQFVATGGRQAEIYLSTTNTYRADGIKLKKIYTYKDWIVTNFIAKTETDYLDGFQYEKSITFSYSGNPELKFVPTSEGYFNFENNKYIYNYTDHLGNVRLSYFNNGTSAEVLEENNYYPFGLKHEGYNPTAGNPSYQYKYNGKELQETGMYDYGARFYMPDIGRWGVVDPLAEKNRRFTPYNYAINNPIRFIDPDGRSESDWIRKDGKWQYDASVTTLEQAQKVPGADGFAKNGTILSNVSVDGGTESAYAQLNEGGSISKLDTDEVGITDILKINSFTTFTESDIMQSFSGGANETDPSTASKARGRDKLETNNMFEYILNGFNRSRTFKGEDGLYQFGIDIQSLNPFGDSSKKSNDTVINATFFNNEKDTTMQFKVPKVGDVYQNWHTGSNYDNLTNPYIKAKIDSVKKSQK